MGRFWRSRSPLSALLVVDSVAGGAVAVKGGSRDGLRARLPPSLAAATQVDATAAPQAAADTAATYDCIVLRLQARPRRARQAAAHSHVMRRRAATCMAMVR